MFFYREVYYRELVQKFFTGYSLFDQVHCLHALPRLPCGAFQEFKVMLKVSYSSLVLVFRPLTLPKEMNYACRCWCVIQ
jgi:hypothetical protein